MPPFSVVIALGRTLFRQGLAALLDAEPDMVVLGEAADADEARRVCQRVQPNLILLGDSLLEILAEGSPGVLSSLRVCCPGAAILVLGEAIPSEPDDAGHRNRSRAIHAGATAFLSAGVDRQELLRVLRAVAGAHGCQIQEAAMDGGECAPAAENGDSGATLPPPASAGRHPITEREREVITLIAQGLCNKEIAQRMDISIQTVKNHVSHLLEKLALADRTQLAVYALEHHFEF